MLLFKNVPPDLSQCVFVIEQALSVRALQEIISSNDAEAVSTFFLSIFYPIAISLQLTDVNL